MGQRTVEDKELSEANNLGIECFVKVVSNKVDQAKDDIRSICLNFDPRAGEGEEQTRIGTGNNLNINNVKPEQYKALCKALGVDRLDEETAIVAVIYKPKDKAKLDEWMKQRARQEQDIDDNQADVTDFDETEKEAAIRKGAENQKRIPGELEPSEPEEDPSLLPKEKAKAGKTKAKK